MDTDKTLAPIIAILNPRVQVSKEKSLKGEGVPLFVGVNRQNIVNGLTTQPSTVRSASG